MKDLNILIVEDDAVALKMISLKLGKEGYPVQTASTGLEALGMIDRTFFDVIITDLMMPGGVDGIGVLEAAKRHNSRTEVLLLTAHASVNTAVAAMRKGATDYLQKPVNFYELFMQLDKISSFKNMAKNTEDLREAMDITEQTAASVIQDLEMELGRLQDLLAETRHVLSKQGIDAVTRVGLALKMLGDSG